MGLTLRPEGSGRVPDGVGATQMTGGVLTIGRRDDNDLVLPDPERHISSQHCVIEQRGNDYFITDNSTNGTVLNHSQQLVRGQAMPLNPGDVITLGQYELRVMIDEPADAGLGAPDPFDDLPPPLEQGSYAQPVQSGHRHDVNEDLDDALGAGGDDDLLGILEGPPQGAAARGKSRAFIPDDPLGPSDGDPFRGADAGVGTGGDPMAELGPGGGGEGGLLPGEDDPLSPGGASEDEWLAGQGARADHAASTASFYGGPKQAGNVIPDDFDEEFGGGGAAPLPDLPPAAPAPEPPRRAPAAAAPPADPEPLPDPLDDPLGDEPLVPPGAAQAAPEALPEDDAEDGDNPFALGAEAPAGDDPFAEAAPPLDPPASPERPVAPAAEPARPKPRAQRVEPPGEPAAQTPPPPPPPTMPSGPPARAATPAPAASAPATPAGVAPGHAASPGAPAPSASAGAVSDRAARAFLEAAGAGHVQVGDAELVETMERLGRAFGTMVTGLREVLMTRSSIKDEFRMNRTQIQAGGNNPLKFSVSPEQALEAMVRAAVPGYMKADEAADGALKDIKAHEVATISGMEAAFKAMLKRLDPKTLEGKLEERGGLGSLLSGKKARYWEVYEKMYGEIARDAEDDFHSLFGKEFARAYQEQLRKL